MYVVRIPKNYEITIRNEILKEFLEKSSYSSIDVTRCKITLKNIHNFISCTHF